MKLIIRVPNWVGDAVMALPTVDAAAEATGATVVSIMTRPLTAPLFQHHPNVDRVVVIEDKKSRVLGPYHASRMIKDDRYDVALILPPSLSSALIFKLAGVAGRVGFAGDSRSYLLTRAVPPPKETMHRARQYLYLLEQITGLSLPLANPRPVLSHEDIASGEKILAKYGLTYDSRYIVIAPQATAASRRWGAANYGRLSARLISDIDCTVILIGSLLERAAGDEVRQIGGARVVNLCGETDLMTAAAIASSARLFVGNDSGLAHLAGAVGCPLVVLSGADNPNETSPLCDHKKVIIKDIDCICCVKNVCPLSGEAFMRCMKLITVDEVCDAAREVIRE
jgi:heptosyltransferase-2